MRAESERFAAPTRHPEFFRLSAAARQGKTKAFNPGLPPGLKALRVDGRGEGI